MNTADDSGARPQGDAQRVPARVRNDDTAHSRAQVHIDEQLDRALKDTFPCSDPVSTLCVEPRAGGPSGAR
jgi:hypothetical protein